MIFSTNGNWVTTAASRNPIEAPIANPASSSTSVCPTCGAIRWKSFTSAPTTWLGVGMM
jgi:hypothetical protein